MTAIFLDSRKTYRSTDNKDSLLLSTDPLNDLVGALRQSISVCRLCGNTVQFKERRHPSQGCGFSADAMMDLRMGVLRVDTCVEAVIERKKSVYHISTMSSKVMDQSSLTSVVLPMCESGSHTKA